MGRGRRKQQERAQYPWNSRSWEPLPLCGSKGKGRECGETAVRKGSLTGRRAARSGPREGEPEEKYPSLLLSISGWGSPLAASAQKPEGKSIRMVPMCQLLGAQGVE